MDRGIAALGAALVLGGVGLAVKGQRAPVLAEREPARAGDAPRTSAHVFLLESARGSDSNGDPIAVDHSDVVALDVDPAGKIAARTLLGSVPRSPQGDARGVVASAGIVFVVANDEDRDFGAHLYKVEGGRVTSLTDGVLRGSRPLVANGAVYTEMGREGAAQDGEVRSDDLQIAAFDAAGKKTVVYAEHAFALHLAGADAFGNLLVYEVRSEGAAIVTVDPRGRVLRRDAIEPFARDFTRDGDLLTFANHIAVAQGRDANGEGSTTPWTVETLDLVHHARSVIHEEDAFQPAPFAFRGTTWFTAAQGPDRSRVLAKWRPTASRGVLGSGASPGRDKHLPLPGLKIAGESPFEALEAIDASGTHAVVAHRTAETASDAQHDGLFLVDLSGTQDITGARIPLDDAAHFRTTLGFVGGEVVR